MSTFFIKDISNIRDPMRNRWAYLFMVRASTPTSRGTVNPKELLSFVEEVLDWCKQQFGDQSFAVWQYHNYEFGFQDDDAAFAFKMRWVGRR